MLSVLVTSTSQLPVLTFFPGALSNVSISLAYLYTCLPGSYCRLSAWPLCVAPSWYKMSSPSSLWTQVLPVVVTVRLSGLSGS